MEKSNRKENNKKRVIEAALKLFIKNGIENTKVTDIASASKLTERSVFRYFETKSDLVLSAALLFWNNAVLKINTEINKDKYEKMNGIKKVRAILNLYTGLFFSSKEELIFTIEAETYLNRCGKISLLENKPPIDFYKSNDPLAVAIKEGISDGSVKSIDNIELVYLNTYDCMLGLMQKMVLDKKSSETDIYKVRLELFIDSLMGIFESI